MRRFRSDLLDPNNRQNLGDADWSSWLNDSWSGPGDDFWSAAMQHATAALSPFLHQAEGSPPAVDTAPGLGEGAESFARKGSGSGSPAPSPSPSPPPPPTSSTVI